MRALVLSTVGTVGAVAAALSVTLVATTPASTAAAPVKAPATATAPAAGAAVPAGSARPSGSAGPSGSAAQSGAERAGHGMPGVASVSGAGKLWYVESADHDIRFGVNAVGVPFSRPVPGIPAGMATDARGTVRFSHLVPGAKKPMRAVADVDCLVTSGRTATLTAIIRSSDAHEKGTRIGISVQQGEHGAPDRLGFSWGQANLDTEARDAEGNVMLSEVGTCMAPAPFTKVVEGGFRVVHADVLKNPGSPAKGARGSAGQGATGDAGRSGGQGIAKGAEKGLGKGGVEGVEGAGRRG